MSKLNLTSKPGLYLYTLFFIITGIFSVVFFESTLAQTNTEKFCISCHEMQTNFSEYEDTPHDKNRTGVVATCPDCHVPKPFAAKILAKLYAVKDLYHHFAGTIDTEEKYETHRLTMAKRVWKYMEDTDSRECRSCHDVVSMDLSEQEGRAARKHKNLEQTGKTCIDCHKGIAHSLPDDYNEDEEPETEPEIL
ncbi:Cytochrome c-type protein NapC [hydrothermal vent metagenome]|uniref:Cytochrome c-type protein NapC n=1 Tax=hydrothermal vent metagenome TaxID=652676 RepID=A0A3B0Y0I3_9ZZZZ